MLLQNEKDIYNKAFGKLIFSNSKLDIYTKEGKLCSVNRDLLVFFSPFIKQLLKDVPVGIKASVVLPDVSIDSLQHIFKVISNGFTDFASIQDLKDAGDILGVSLSSLEYIEMDTEKNVVRADTKVLKDKFCTEEKKKSFILETNIKKEVIDELEVKLEPSEGVSTNVTSEEIPHNPTLKTKNDDEASNEAAIKVRDDILIRSESQRPDADKMKPPSDQLIPNFPIAPSGRIHKRRKTPSQIRRNLRRAMLHKNSLNTENSETRDETNKAVTTKSLESVIENTLEIITKHKVTDEQKSMQSSQTSELGKNAINTYKSNVYENHNLRQSWQPLRTEAATCENSSRLKHRDFGLISHPQSRDPRIRSISRSREFTTMVKDRSRSPATKYRKHTINPFYTLEEGEID